MNESTVPNLRTLRTQRQLTQAQLGEALGVTSRTVMRWEIGEGEPGARELIAMARFFRISVDNLVGDLTESRGPLPRVSDLIGNSLDYWVAKLQRLQPTMTDDGPVTYQPGHGQVRVPNFSTDWTAAGAIIERHVIHLNPVIAGTRFDGKTLDAPAWMARCSEHPYVEIGPTPPCSSDASVRFGRVWPAARGIAISRRLPRRRSPSCRHSERGPSPADSRCYRAVAARMPSSRPLQPPFLVPYRIRDSRSRPCGIVVWR